MTLFDDWLNSNNLHHNNDRNHHNSDHHDHSYDHYDHNYDLGHDHSWDALCFVDDSHSYDLTDLDSHHSDYQVHAHFDPHHVDGIVVGEPAKDMQHWHHQHRSDSCAIASQEFILESITGKHFSEAKLCHEAYVDGCYHPGGGTPAMHVGHLLEQHGIPVEQHHNSTFAELQDKLDHHEKIIVGVDSHTLWMPDKGSVVGDLVSSYHGIPGQKADHAVEVIGIKYPNEDPTHPYVILNDPGSKDGKGMMVPYEQFESAWAAGDHFMVSTELHHNDHHNGLNDADQMTLGCSVSTSYNNVYIDGHDVGTYNGNSFYWNSGKQAGSYDCTNHHAYNCNGQDLGYARDWSAAATLIYKQS